MKNSKIRGYEVKKIFKKGKRIRTEYFHLIFLKNLLEYTRTMVIIGKRFGKAVKRNRTKRVFKEILRLEKGDIILGVDIIILPQKRDREIDFHSLRMVIRDVLQRESLIHI